MLQLNQTRFNSVIFFGSELNWELLLINLGLRRFLNCFGNLKMNDQMEKKEKIAVEKELSKLMEITLNLENELNSITLKR